MPPPARATVESIDDEDDPYAPYRPGQASSISSTNRAQPSATAAYDASPSSGTQGTFPASGGDEEPLFGGRPFRDAHSTSSSSSTDKEHLYAILNVPLTATPDAIKDAYRSLAIAFHPDKHSDPTRKRAAESRFRDVQRAYEILSDPEKRAVYDHFGEEGLKSTWTVTRRGRGVGEMREEMERERRRREVVDAEGLVKSKGDFTAHVDASALFAPSARVALSPARQGAPGNLKHTVSFADRISRVGCTQLIGKHGFETQLTTRSSATLSGQMVSRNGLGGGNLVGTVKTHWSPRLFSEVTLSFLRPQIVTTKGQFTVDANSFFSWQGTMQTWRMPPSLNLTYGQRLSAKSSLTGFTSVRSGTYSLGPWGREVGGMLRREPAAVSVGLTKQSGEGRGWTTQLSVSPVDQAVSYDYATVLAGVKVRSGFNMGTGSGVSAFTSAERRVTENVRLSVGLTCALPAGGVTLRLKVNRLGQKILLPILLSKEFRPDLVLAFTAIPVVAYGTLHYGYLEPRKQGRLKNRLAELRGANADVIRERREAACEAVEVLREQAWKRARQELGSSGLVMVEAWYGRKSDFPNSPFSATSRVDLEEQAQRVWTGLKNAPPSTQQVDLEKETAWDARIALQALISKGQLIIPGGRSKANLLGFHDPVMGEKKHLLVVYVFRGQLHRVVVEDWDEVALPMRIHQV
uniref:J domain-containing protein n=1 Tax=Kalmanozyma brasiliensis (strain GHG001) TaxID=1365824 RepID=V5E4U1_KALBG